MGSRSRDQYEFDIAIRGMVVGIDHLKGGSLIIITDERAVVGFRRPVWLGGANAFVYVE